MDIKGGDDHGGNTSWAETFAQFKGQCGRGRGREGLQHNHFYQDKWVGGWERTPRGPRSRGS